MYLVSKPAFKAEMDAIRQAQSIPLAGFESEVAYEEWAEKFIYRTYEGNEREEAIDWAIARIISNANYRLAPGWHHSLKRYLFFNDVDDMELPIRLSSKLSKDAETGKTTIHIIVTGDTTKQDYIDAWESNVEHMRKLFELESPPLQRQADVHKLRRKKLAYESWLSTGSYDETAKIVENWLPDSSGVKVYTYDDAKTDVQNFIKQAGIYPYVK